jgi:malate dehydrogenase (oxaloacetate-decarboxylating)(NADP+)
VVFAEAEEEVVLRAAIQFRDFGYGIRCAATASAW